MVRNPNILITEGKFRDLLIDIDNDKIAQIDHAITKVIKLIDLYGFDELVGIISQSDDENWKRYLSFLIDNNVILDFNTLIGEFIPKVEEKELASPKTLDIEVTMINSSRKFIIEEKIEYLVVHWSVEMSINKYVELFDSMRNSVISFVQLIDDTGSISLQAARDILNLCPMTARVSVFRAKRSFSESGISLYQEDLSDRKFDIAIFPPDISFHSVMLSKKYNVYYHNRLIHFQSNSDDDHQVYSGEIDIAHPQEVVSKNLIQKCRYCELRDVCIDRRLPAYNDSQWAYSYDCNYNLESGEWES